MYIWCMWVWMYRYIHNEVILDVFYKKNDSHKCKLFHSKINKIWLWVKPSKFIKCLIFGEKVLLQEKTTLISVNKLPSVNDNDWINSVCCRHLKVVLCSLLFHFVIWNPCFSYIDHIGLKQADKRALKQSQ